MEDTRGPWPSSLLHYITSLEDSKAWLGLRDCRGKIRSVLIQSSQVAGGRISAQSLPAEKCFAMVNAMCVAMFPNMFCHQRVRFIRQTTKLSVNCALSYTESKNFRFYRQAWYVSHSSLFMRPLEKTCRKFKSSQTELKGEEVRERRRKDMRHELVLRCKLVGHMERSGIPVKSEMGLINKMIAQMTWKRWHWKDGDLDVVGLLQVNNM